MFGMFGDLFDFNHDGKLDGSLFQNKIVLYFTYLK